MFLKSKRGSVLAILVVIVVIITIGLFLYQTFRAKEVKVLDIERIRLCSYIDENYNCELQPSAEYEIGKGLYVYATLSGFNQDKDGAVFVTEDAEIKDSDGKIIFIRKDFAAIQAEYEEGIEVLEFKNEFPTFNLKTGVYSVKITLNDKIAGDSISKTLSFVLKKRDVETKESSVDISGLFTDGAPNLIRQKTVWGPDGNVIPELTYNQTFIGDFEELDLIKINVIFEIPPRFDAGTYRVQYKFIDLDTGESVIAEERVTVIKELQIAKLVFASNIDDYFNYIVQPNAVYSVGDMVYIYINIIDFAQPEVDNKYSAKIEQDAALYTEEGDLMVFRSNYSSINDLNNRKEDSYDIVNAFDTTGMLPGKYIYEASVFDLNSDQSASKRAFFWIE